MDLRKAVVDSFDRLINSGEIETAIEQQLRKTIDSILKDVLSSYGDFGKTVKEAVQNAVACNGEIDLPSYNDLVVKVIRRQVDHALNDTIERQVADRVTELLKAPPKSIKVSEVVQAFIEHTLKRGCHCDAPRITFLITRSESCSGYWHLVLDDEPDKSEFAADVRIGVTGEDEVYSLSLGRDSVEKRLFVGPLYGFEKMLFQLYVAKSRLVDDSDTFDVQDLIYAAVGARD